jgi:hypothetical protein
MGEAGRIGPQERAAALGLDHPLGRSYDLAALNLQGVPALFVGVLPRQDGEAPSTLFLRQDGGGWAPVPGRIRGPDCAAVTGPCWPAEDPAVTGGGLLVQGFFDGDDHADIALMRPDNRYFRGDGAGGFDGLPERFAGAWPADAAAGDLDNDGLFELVLIGRTDGALGPHGLAVSRGMGPAAPVEPRNGAAPGGRPVSLVTGDFDADMDLDLLTLDAREDGRFALSFWENDGAGGLARHVHAGPARGGYPQALSVADYNLDGALDLVVAHGGADWPAPAPPGGGYALMEGQPGAGGWLGIDLVDPWSLGGLGARVVVTAGGVAQHRIQDLGMHVAVQDDPRLHVGLGPHRLAAVTVTWPDGAVTATTTAADRIVTIRHPALPPG